MIKQDLDINAKQLDDMKHCIGFSREKIEEGMFLAWRNHFSTPDHDPDWDMLVVLGLAAKAAFKLGHGPNPHFYQVSKEGIKYLENELKVKIIVK